MDTDKYKIEVEENGSREVNELILQRLTEFYKPLVGEYSRIPYSVSVKNNDEKLIAAAAGAIRNKHDCDVYLVFVEEPYRYQGVGSNMLKKIEQLARQHNCYHMTVSTTQAEEFYKKCGFLSIFTLEKGFLGLDQIHMQKIL